MPVASALVAEPKAEEKAASTTMRSALQFISSLSVAISSVLIAHLVRALVHAEGRHAVPHLHRIVHAMQQQRVALLDRAAARNDAEDLRLLRRDEAEWWSPLLAILAVVLAVHVTREPVRVVAPRDGRSSARHAARHALVDLGARWDAQPPAGHELHLEGAHRRAGAESEQDAGRVDPCARVQLLRSALAAPPIHTLCRGQRQNHLFLDRRILEIEPERRAPGRCAPRRGIYYLESRDASCLAFGCVDTPSPLPPNMIMWCTMLMSTCGRKVRSDLAPSGAMNRP